MPKGGGGSGEKGFGGNVAVLGKGEVEEESTRRNQKVQKSTVLLPLGGSWRLGCQVIHHS